MIPFHVRYELPRGPRLAAYLAGWAPCLAATAGFTLGVTFLSAVVSRWFLLLFLCLALPAFVTRRLFPGLLDLVLHSRESFELTTDADGLAVVSRRGREWLPLEGVMQVFRAGDLWTVLHTGGAVVQVPAGALSDEQVEFLKAAARRSAARARQTA